MCHKDSKELLDLMNTYQFFTTYMIYMVCFNNFSRKRMDPYIIRFQDFFIFPKVFVSRLNKNIKIILIYIQLF
jgi:hypothetical protein